MSDQQLREGPGDTEGRLVMPFYLVCDVSYSMVNDMPALNDGIRRLRKAIVDEPTIDDVAQLSIITFSDSATVALQMTQMSEHNMPTLSAQAGTNYGAAFRTLAKAIPQDIANLKAQGCRVYRPCAFFLSDGEPLDNDWQRSFTSTLTYDKNTRTGMKEHPIFVPFGYRDAPEDVLKKLAYPPERGRWYHVKNDDIEQALKGILGVIRNTVITSGRTAQSNQPAIVPQVPDPGSGIASGESEYNDDIM